jgi:hypothetical protein
VWAHFAVAATVGNVVPVFLVGIGKLSIDSALAGIFNATTPLWTVTVALLARMERTMTAIRAAGLVLGFAGAPHSPDSVFPGGTLTRPTNRGGCRTAGSRVWWCPTPSPLRRPAQHCGRPDQPGGTAAMIEKVAPCGSMIEAIRP